MLFITMVTFIDIRLRCGPTNTGDLHRFHGQDPEPTTLPGEPSPLPAGLTTYNILRARVALVLLRDRLSD